MLPFIVLVTALLVFRVVGWIGVPVLNNWLMPVRAALAIMFLFLFTASAHLGEGTI